MIKKTFIWQCLGLNYTITKECYSMVIGILIKNYSGSRVIRTGNRSQIKCS